MAAHVGSHPSYGGGDIVIIHKQKAFGYGNLILGCRHVRMAQFFLV